MGLPCSRRRSGAHTPPRSDPCPRAVPARRPRWSPSALTRHHPPSRSTTLVASPPGVVGPRDATKGVCDVCRSSRAPHDQARRAGCPRSAQNQFWGDDQNAAARQCAAHRREVEHRPGPQQVQPLIHRAACPRHPYRVPVPGTNGLVSRGDPGDHPPVHWNRAGPLCDVRARRARAVRTGPLMLAGTPWGQQMPTAGLEHTPGKITRRHQQMHPTIHRAERPPRQRVHRVSSPSRRAARSAKATRAARNCSSLSPGASPARATTLASTDRNPPSRTIAHSSSRKT